MYLNLLYNGKKYLYETNSKLNIGHLKELSEKILNSDKNFMHIIYNNNKYIFPNDKTFLKDLIPKGKRRTAFSIKVDDKDSNNNEDPVIVNENNSRTPKNNNHSSLEEALKSNSKKRILRNFSNIWSNQKKFNNTITYKYNEFLIEIREFNRRINEVYEQLFQNYTQSNINYNNFISETNCNDVNNKLTEISQFEYQMIKFIEKEKIYYQKLNQLIRKCILTHNNKIVISNKYLQELYKELFSDNNRNIDIKIDESENNNNLYSIDNSSNKYSYKLFSPLELKSPISENTSSILKHKNLHSMDDSLDKTIKIKQKKTLPLLNHDIISNNEIIGSKDKKMLISTELGKDGIERGKITLFSGDDKKSLFGLKKQKNKNKEEEGGDNGSGPAEGKDENNQKINLIKNRLIFRNKKNKEYFSPFKTKDDGIKNKNVLKNFSSEGPFNEKNKLKKLKVKKTKSTIELNSNLEIINNHKSVFNKKTKSNKNIYRKNYINNDNNKKNSNKNNNKNDEENNNNLNNINSNTTSDNTNLNKNNDNPEDNKSNKDNKDNKSNEEKEKENKEIKNNEIENTNSNFKSNFSDSSDYAKNKNESDKVISNINAGENLENNDGKNTSINNNNDNKDNNDNNKIININNNEKENEKNDKNDKNKNLSNIDNKKENESVNDNNNEEEDFKNNKKHGPSLFNKNLISKNLLSTKKYKKKKKRKRSSDDDDSSEDKDNDESDDENNNKKTKLKKKYENNVISEENNESEETKKEETKDPFDDLKILRSFLKKDDNPYKRDAYPGSILNRNLNNEIFEPINESDEEEQKKMNLIRRKKKQLIKNKYDFLI